MIYVLSGGGSGATLVVTGVAGDTCIITNGTKTHTKTFGTDKKATFKGLATGTWTVKMTNGSKTSTRTITITADYSLTIAYFSATIKVTYPAKSKCVIKNSSGTQVASNTNTETSAKTWTATVNAKGTYTVTATATDGSGKTTSTTVSITADGQSKSVTLVYELVLFNNGDVTSLTGGWQATCYSENYGSAKIADGLITIQGATAYGGSATAYQTLYMTKNKIDFTSYKAFKAHINTVSERAALLIKTQQTFEGWWDAPLIADTCVGYKKLTTSDAGANASVDISSLTGSYYVGFLVDGNGKIVTPKVWLE